MATHRNVDEIVGVPPRFNSRWRYYSGPAGIGGYTTKPDADGWFWSFWCKPVGRGARAGQAVRWRYVERMTAKRRHRKDAESRSYNLSQGLPVTEGVRRKPKPQNNPPGTGYCMKEKKTVLMLNMRAVQAKNGRSMIQGECPDCGQIIHKYGKLAECPECGKMAEMAASDYICKVCRG